MDLDSKTESKLISLICQLYSLSEDWGQDSNSDPDSISKLPSCIIQIISLVSSMDLDSEPKPESELMSLITQTIYVFDSIDLNSQPRPLRKLISLISRQYISRTNSIYAHLKPDRYMFMDLLVEAGSLTPEMELISKKFPIHSKLMFLVAETMSLEPEPKLISLVRKILSLVISKNSKLKKLTSFCPQAQVTFKEGIIHVIEEVLQPTNNKWKCLRLNWQKFRQPGEEGYTHFFCEACNDENHKEYNEAPLEIKHPLHPKHLLKLVFSRGSLITRECYCCDKYLRGNWFCGVCRRKIDNDYGSYSCIKEGCSYVAHSKCATQSNVWDGVELEGELEEVEEEEVEPFVTISDRIIQHFSHQHHHLRLDVNTARDYDENKMCQACIMPVYIGNFYSCMQCDFILHEEWAKLSRKIHHPIHPHLLTLMGGYDGVMDYHKDTCSACPWLCKTGFFYECSKEGCRFMLHVQCATISEPLVHPSHLHPLFLTSKPGEKQRICSVCKELGHHSRNETFNCIECEYFALCFKCATLPHKVRYKYDKHMLTLSYGDETSTTTHWCEVCEGKINPRERFYV